MAEKRDYYEVLGVPKDADDATIKRAFKRLAIKYHPDRNHEEGAEKKFQEINEAYQVLSDPQKRASYDQFGFDAVNGSQGGGGNPFGQGADFNYIFCDIFGDIFGGGTSSRSQGPRVVPGRDLRYRVTLTLEEAVRGVKKSFKVKSLVKCRTCGGSGASASGRSETCPHCHGSGRVFIRQGFMNFEQTCSHCNGTGRIITNPCPDCHGEGRVEDTRTLSVDIPAGVDNGDRMRLAGDGEAGLNGAPAGDLYVEIRVADHDIFKRDGDDLYCEIPISFSTAALGGIVEVPTLDGKVNLTVRPETQTGTKMRLSGKGVKSIHSSSKGNLYVTLVVETPVK